MSALALQIPFGGTDILTWVFQIAFYAIFIAFMFYGQRFQLLIMMREVEGSLNKLKVMRDEGRKISISTIKEVGKSSVDPTERVDRFLEYVSILPESMDPSGIVWKLEHLLDVREVRFKDDVKLMAPGVDENQLNNFENMLEAAMVLNYIYKVVRHFYLTGKKTYSLYIMMQLQMILPLVMKEAKAFARALKAFDLGQPIGDGAGALVAAKLMRKYEKKEIAKEVVAAEVPIEGRRAWVLKAKGPGGSTGKPGEAVKSLVEENSGNIATVIMIDAAGKLEGEETGEIAEGVGAAIGGPGVDKFKIEEAAMKYKIPVNAILIKTDIGDAVSPMRKEIFDATDKAVERIKRVLLERTKEGDLVIIAGIGNTAGIAQ